MHRAGVNIMAGTDAGVLLLRGVIPGISLHSEIALFVKAGFAPLEALRAATLAPARFLKMESTTGSIERGKAADLVLLEANPLEDIRHTEKIAAVILGGRLHDRRALDAMLGYSC
jgi:imidazolonepropionase-like amidohydrolase